MCGPLPDPVMASLMAHLISVVEEDLINSNREQAAAVHKFNVNNKMRAIKDKLCGPSCIEEAIKDLNKDVIESSST